MTLLQSKWTVIGSCGYLINNQIQSNLGSQKSSISILFYTIISNGKIDLFKNGISFLNSLLENIKFKNRGSTVITKGQSESWAGNFWSCTSSSTQIIQHIHVEQNECCFLAFFNVFTSFLVLINYNQYIVQYGCHKPSDYGEFEREPV